MTMTAKSGDDNGRSRLDVLSPDIPKSSYPAVHLVGDETAGRLCLMTKGLIYYPSSNDGRKVKLAWSSIDSHSAISNILKVIYKKTKKVEFTIKDNWTLIQVMTDMTERIRRDNSVADDVELDSNHSLQSRVFEHDHHLMDAHDSFSSHLSLSCHGSPLVSPQPVKEKNTKVRRHTSLSRSDHRPLHRPSLGQRRASLPGRSLAHSLATIHSDYPFQKPQTESLSDSEDDGDSFKDDSMRDDSMKDVSITSRTGSLSSHVGEDWAPSSLRNTDRPLLHEVDLEAQGTILDDNELEEEMLLAEPPKVAESNDTEELSTSLRSLSTHFSHGEDHFLLDLEYMEAQQLQQDELYALPKNARAAKKPLWGPRSICAILTVAIVGPIFLALLLVLSRTLETSSSSNPALAPTPTPLTGPTAVPTPAPQVLTPSTEIAYEYDITRRPTPLPITRPPTPVPVTSAPITRKPTSVPVTSAPLTRRPTPGPTQEPTPLPTTKRPTPLPTPDPTPAPTTKRPTPTATSEPSPEPTTLRPTPIATLASTELLRKPKNREEYGTVSGVVRDLDCLGPTTKNFALSSAFNYTLSPSYSGEPPTHWQDREAEIAVESFQFLKRELTRIYPDTFQSLSGEEVTGKTIQKYCDSCQEYDAVYQLGFSVFLSFSNCINPNDMLHSVPPTLKYKSILSSVNKLLPADDSGQPSSRYPFADVRVMRSHEACSIACGRTKKPKRRD